MWPQARYLSGRCPLADHGPSIGHDRVPTVFWGSKEPGAGKGSSRTVPTALILMGDWCVPERCTITKRTKTRVRITGKASNVGGFRRSF